MDNKFSFPVIIPGAVNNDDQFEFGCIMTPGSPNSPADRLFANGKLLPHVFPIQTVPSSYYSFSRSASRTSSKDYSLVSSRSNSSNSRSSNSSARTSTSEASSSFSGRGLSSNRLPARKERNHGHVNRPVLGPQVYGTAQRWQLIAAAPVLKKHQAGSRSRGGEVLDREMSRKTRPPVEERGGAKTSWFGKRIFKAFVSTCKECHAIAT